MPLTDEEKKRIYEEERERIIAQDKAKTALKAEKSKQGAIGCLIFFVVIVIIAAVVSICNQPKSSNIPPPEVPSAAVRDPYAETPEEAKGKFIDYEILRQWYPPNGGIGMEILVPEKSKKSEVMALAKHLRAQNMPKSFIFIGVYDLREAYNHKDDENYSDKKFNKHFLLVVTHNGNTNYDQFDWIAEGRNH